MAVPVRLREKKVVKTYRLRSGHTKSCGCQNGDGGPRHALGLSYVDGTCVDLHDQFLREYAENTRCFKDADLQIL